MKLNDQAAVFWLVCYACAVAAVISYSGVSLKFEGLNEIGDFFGGILGPVALIWIVLGYLQQSREMRQSVDALQAQVKIQQSTLDANIRIDEEARKTRKKEIMPNLHVLGGGGNIQNTTFRIINKGAKAIDVELIPIKNGVAGLHKRDYPIFEEGEEKKFYTREQISKTEQLVAEVEFDLK